MPLTTKAGKRSRTPSTARGILIMIDRFLSSPEVSYIERRSLWNILSAIRGPDIGVGKSLTVQVRAKAFPRTAAQSPNGFANGAQMKLLVDDLAMTLDDLFELDDVLARPSERHTVRSSHFSAHLSAAFYALKAEEEREAGE